ncbi:MAG: hypothetical protein MJK10_14640 [Pseudomonadales bacterium]|nr:hypothetical protein [Pseudomonadales bacterium]NRA17119.1 hypothetical protein [Oceanospirillaceae bacterium]
MLKSAVFNRYLSRILELQFYIDDKRNILIVFTIKNIRTNTVYVGTTKDNIDERWAVYQLAKDLPLDAPLYEDMRKFGIPCFVIEEYDFAETRQELAELYEDAMLQFDGISLKGMKTSLPRTAVYTVREAPKAKPVKKTVAKAKAVPKVKAVASSIDKLKAELNAISAVTAITKSSTSAKVSTSSARVSTSNSNLIGMRRKPVETAMPSATKLKLSSGRTGSAIREKKIKEGIQQEKDARDALKQQQVSQQADEMKAIMARLDSRGSSLKKRF